MSEPEGSTLKKVQTEEIVEMLGVMLRILKKLQGTDERLYHPDVLSQWLLQLGGWLPTLGGVTADAFAAWKRAGADLRTIKSQQSIQARKDGAKTATAADRIAEGSEPYLEKANAEIAAEGDKQRMINYREDIRESMQAIKKVIDLKIAEMKHGT